MDIKRGKRLEYYDDPLIIPDIRCYEPDWQDVLDSCKTGILDSNGEMIVRKPDRQTYIGFLDPDRLR